MYVEREGSWREEVIARLHGVLFEGWMGCRAVHTGTRSSLLHAPDAAGKSKDAIEAIHGYYAIAIVRPFSASTESGIFIK